MSAVYQWEGMYPDGVAGRGLSPCMECGLPHTPERRQAVLRRMLPASTVAIREGWDHLWPDTSAGKRHLQLDLRAMGATRDADGLWSLS